MKCGNCGFVNPANSSFCQQCGVALHPVPMPAQAAPPATTQVWAPPAPAQPWVPPAPEMPPRKSIAVAFFLTLFFGPLGLFYATIAGALIMIAVSAGAWVFFFMLVVGRMDVYDPGFTTSGISWVSLLALGIWAALWLASIVWALAAVSSYNNKLLARSQYAPQYPYPPQYS